MASNLIFLAVASTFAAASALAGEAVTIDKVEAAREGSGFTAAVHTSAAWDDTSQAGVVSAKITPETLQFEFEGLITSSDKQIIAVNDPQFKSVVVIKSGESASRIVVVLRPGYSAQSIADKVQVKRTDDGFAIETPGSPEKLARRSGSAEAISRVYQIVDAESASELSEKLIVENHDGDEAKAKTSPESIAQTATAAGAGPAAAVLPAAAQPIAVPAASMNKLPESEIPVVITAKEAKKVEGGMYQRILITLGVLLTCLAALVFGLKRWTSPSGSKSLGAKIRILTQHHLGPKKSLAIIQVAGESILIGITDHNISMIKSLALIDDEIPDTSPKDFNKTLSGIDDDYAEQFTPAKKVAAEPAPNDKRSRRSPIDVKPEHEEVERPGNLDDFALRGISEIRDVVTNRLKNMRNLG